MRTVLWALFALITTSPVVAAPVPLAAAHATVEPLAGWMVTPAGAYVAMTKIGETSQVYVYPAEGFRLEDGQRFVDAMYPGSGAKLAPTSLKGHKGRAAEVTGISKLFGFPTKSHGFFVWSPHGDAVLVLAFDPQLDEGDVRLVRTVSESVRFDPMVKTPAVAFELGSVWQGVQARGKAPAGLAVEEASDVEVLFRGERPRRALSLRVLPDVGGRAARDVLQALATESQLALKGAPRTSKGVTWTRIETVQQGQTLGGYVAVRMLDRERAMVGLAFGHFADEKELLRTLASVRSKAFPMHPEAKAVARKLNGKRLSYLSSSSDSSNGYVGDRREIYWHFCSDGSYSYSFSSRFSISGGGFSSSGGNSDEHDGRWLLRKAKGGLVLELQPSDREPLSYDFTLVQREGLAARIGDQDLKFMSPSDVCD